MMLAPAARTAALVVALVSAAALAVQVALSLAGDHDLVAALWLLARFFTILTNTLVALSFGLMVVRGHALPTAWLGGLTLWIVIVGVVYHLLLAKLYAPTGVDWWVDQAFHTGAPVLAVLWWLACAPKADLVLRHAFLWLVWPLAYTAYALVRGAFDGVYPYPFLDVSEIGYGGVAVNAAGKAAGCLAGGLVVIGLARMFSR